MAYLVHLVQRVVVLEVEVMVVNQELLQAILNPEK